jgi:3-oxoacyl-[acyl-carrier-protein] synthase-3
MRLIHGLQRDLEAAMSSGGIGILSIAYFLPEDIRTNDWWPEEIVKEWRASMEERVTKPPKFDFELTDGMRAVIEEMVKLRNDPFRGIKERRVVKEGQTPTEIEAIAAKMALERAGIEPSEIHLLMENGWLQEDLNAPNACLLHKRLGLPYDCYSLTTQVACNGFIMQMPLAEQMIKSGMSRYALLVYSGVVSPMLKIDDPLCCTFGDGAVAVVVGPVSESKGLLGHAHRTDGDFYKVLRMGVPGGSWYDEGKGCFYSDDGRNGYRMLLEIPDTSREVTLAALEQTEHKPEEVDFYTSHMGTAWFRKVSQEACGFTNARWRDTYETLGNLTSGNIPLGFALAEEEGLLKDGDLVAAHSGGSGITLSSLVIRWGT